MFVFIRATRAVLLLGLLVIAGNTFAAKIYADNGDGTVTDPTTGLTWMRCSMGQIWGGGTCTGSANGYAWDSATALTGKVVFGGQGDWRLPNIRELQTIVNRSGIVPAIDGVAFPNTPAAAFWSATPGATATFDSWAIYFDSGISLYGLSRRWEHHARLVRGAASSALLAVARPDTDYSANADGTVLHKLTGLVWKRCSEGQNWDGTTCVGVPRIFTPTEAKVLLQMPYSQKDSWRLPTAVELQSLVDYTRFDPAVNTTIFPASPSGNFIYQSDQRDWSAQTADDLTWFLNTRLGSFRNHVDFEYSNAVGARFVRDGQSIGAPVNVGWNLLGNSLTSDMLVSKEFGDPELVTSVWKWDAGAAIWQFYAPSMDSVTLQNYANSKGYGVLSMVGPGEGYWVNAKVPTSVGTQLGSPFNLTASNLVTGWNLVATGGDIAPPAFNTSLYANPSNIGVTSLWAWDNGRSQWYFYAPDLETNGTLSGYIASKGYLDFAQYNKTLGSGTGFWVNRPHIAPIPYYEVYGAQLGETDLSTIMAKLPSGFPLIGTSLDGNSFSVAGYARFIIYAPTTSSKILFDAIGLDAGWVKSQSGVEYAHTGSNVGCSNGSPTFGCIEGPPDGITMETLNVGSNPAWYSFSTFGAATLNVHVK